MVNHPAGWVIERGGVALLMFVDPVSFGVLYWVFSFFLLSLRVNFIGFIVFLCAGHQIWTFHPPERYSFFGGSFHKVTVGPWFWHMKTVFFCAKVWSLCQVFASKRHQKLSWKLIEKITT